MALKSVTGADFNKKHSRAFKDVSMGLERNPFTNDASTLSNAEAIKSAVKNIVLTAPGEKFFNPNFGSKISQLLFEPLDPFLVNAIQTEILNTIRNYEKRVTVKTVRCKANYDDNSINVFVQYKIVGLPLTESVNFVLQRP